MKIWKENLRFNLLHCFLLLLVAISSGQENFSEPFLLGKSSLHDATAFYGRHVAVASDGVVHVVWSSENADDSPEVWYTHSLANGDGFTPATTIHEGLTGTRPAIAVDPANPLNIFVAYCGSPRSGEKTGIRVIRSTDGGNTWSASVQICGTAPQSTNPDILVDWVGNPHVAFNSLYDSYIRYNFSSDGGETWPDPPEIVNIGRKNGYAVGLSLSPDGKLHILFDSDKAPQTMGNKAVYWTSKTIEEVWEIVPAEMLPGSGDGTPYPTLVWDSKGVGHAWFDAKGIENNNRNVYYVRYENEVWGAPQAIPSWMPGGSTYMPSAAINAEDNLYVVYLDALQKDVDLVQNNGDVFVGTNRSGEWEYFNLTQNGLAAHERFPAAAREVINGKFALVYTGGPAGGPYSVIYQDCFASRCQRGDINRDHQITPGDAQIAFHYYLSDGNPPPEYASPCLPDAADINCDGEVTPLDALEIFHAYLAALPPPLECVGESKLAKTTLQITSKNAASGNEVFFEIQIQNNGVIQAVGFDLQYPDDLLEFQRLEATSLTENWVALNASENTPGVLSIGGFDPTGIQPVESAKLVRVIFRVKESTAGSGELVFRNLKDHLAQSECFNGTFATPETAVAQENVNNRLPQYQLEPNFPNPFNPDTRVKYHLPEKGWVQLTVFNALGQKICTLVSEIQQAGSYQIQWNGRNDAGRPVSAGIYLLRIEVNGFTDLQKMLLVK